jgi:putative membrane protein (TIGR04086 family)
MTTLFNKYKKYIYLLLFLFLALFILSIIYLYGNISYNVINTIILILMMIFAFIIGYFQSINTNEKGIITGLKSGIILIAILFVLGIIFHTPFKLTRIIYYIILLLITILGSIFGKNKK